MYFIWGNEDYLINYECNKIVKTLTGTVIYFDDEADLSDIIREINTISLFKENKIIVLKNLQFLLNKQFSKLEDFYQVVKKVSPNVQLIFLLLTEKLNSKNDLVDYLIRRANVTKVLKPKASQLVSLVKLMASEEKGKISNRAAIKLVVKLPNNLAILNQEIKKLVNQSQQITEEMVEQSTSSYKTDNFFALTNALVSGNAYNIIKAYQDEINNNNDPIQIISQLATNYQMGLLIKKYQSLNYSMIQISKLTNKHLYFLQKINQILQNKSIPFIESVIHALAELDLMIKSGTAVKKQALDHFILKLVR